MKESNYTVLGEISENGDFVNELVIEDKKFKLCTEKTNMFEALHKLKWLWFMDDKTSSIFNTEIEIYEYYFKNQKDFLDQEVKIVGKNIVCKTGDKFSQITFD